MYAVFTPRKALPSIRGHPFVAIVLAHLGRSCGWEFTHTFSCESDPEKQAWLREHFPPIFR